MLKSLGRENTVTVLYYHCKYIVYKMNCLSVTASFLSHTIQNTVDAVRTTNTRHRKWKMWKINIYLQV